MNHNNELFFIAGSKEKPISHYGCVFKGTVPRACTVSFSSRWIAIWSGEYHTPLLHYQRMFLWWQKHHNKMGLVLGDTLKLPPTETILWFCDSKHCEPSTPVPSCWQQLKEAILAKWGVGQGGKPLIQNYVGIEDLAFNRTFFLFIKLLKTKPIHLN